MKVEATVNGMRVERDIEPRLLLSDFLRHHLRLTGTHVGCESGVCGACNVLLDGAAVRSCLLFAVQIHQHALTTVEGLEGADALRQSLVQERALQCGFCTPGFLITLAELRGGLAGADEAVVRQALLGNLCRCTGYAGVVAAARRR
jgi:aerobic carbon-monoxide dehydrogenase small subunit